MKEHDWQTIIGQAPSKSNSYRIILVAGHPKLGKTGATEKYERDFYMQVGAYRNLMITGLFELHVRVYFTTMSHDLDNSLKVILDCLQQTKTIKNDNKCVKIVAEKFIDKNNPRIEFRIIEI
jgi:Holliday junction resolvase RusA-like endonuclease